MITIVDASDLAGDTAHDMPRWVLDSFQTIMFTKPTAADRGQEVGNSSQNTESLGGIGGKQKVIVYRDKNGRRRCPEVDYSLLLLLRGSVLKDTPLVDMSVIRKILIVIPIAISIGCPHRAGNTN